MKSKISTLFWTLVFCLVFINSAVATTSTINPNIPPPPVDPTKSCAVPGNCAPLQSMPLRNNFTAAYNDVNSLWMAVTNIGTSAIYSLVGDGATGTVSGGTATLTLSSVNSNVGSVGSGTQVPVLNIDAKGRILSASQATITPAGIGALGVANNLSDLASISSARSNLGLGSAALQNIGTSGSTVPLNNGNLTLSGSDTFTQTIGVNLGSTSLPTPLTGGVIELKNTDGTPTRVECIANGASCYFSSAISGGTTGAPVAIGTGQELGGFNGFGWNGSGIVGPRVSLRTYGAESWGSTNNGTYLDLSTTPIGSTVMATGVRVNADGSMTIPPAVTGGDKGSGSVNAVTLFQNGNQVIDASSYSGNSYGGPLIANGTSSVASMPTTTYLGACEFPEYINDNGGYTVKSFQAISNHDTQATLFQNFLLQCGSQAIVLLKANNGNDNQDYNLQQSCILAEVPRMNIWLTSSVVVPAHVCTDSRAIYIRDNSYGSTVSSNWYGLTNEHNLKNVYQPLFIYPYGAHNVGTLQVLADQGDGCGTDSTCRGSAVFIGRVWAVQSMFIANGGTGYQVGDWVATANGDFYPAVGAAAQVTQIDGGSGSGIGAISQISYSCSATSPTTACGTYSMPQGLQLRYWTAANGWYAGGPGGQAVFDTNGNYYTTAASGHSSPHGTGAILGVTAWEPDFCDGTNGCSIPSTTFKYAGYTSVFYPYTSNMGSILVAQSNLAANISATYGPTVGIGVNGHDIVFDSFQTYGADFGVVFTHFDVRGNIVNPVNAGVNLAFENAGSVILGSIKLDTARVEYMHIDASNGITWGSLSTINPNASPVGTTASIILGGDTTYAGAFANNTNIEGPMALQYAGTTTGIPAIYCANTKSSNINALVTNLTTSAGVTTWPNTSFINMTSTCANTNTITGSIDNISVGSSVFNGTLSSNPFVNVWVAGQGMKTLYSGSEVTQVSGRWNGSLVQIGTSSNTINISTTGVGIGIGNNAPAAPLDVEQTVTGTTGTILPVLSTTYTMSPTGTSSVNMTGVTNNSTYNVNQAESGTLSAINNTINLVTTGTIGTVIGAQNQYNLNSAALVSNGRGAQNLASDISGGTTQNLVGAYNRANHNAATTDTNEYGAYNYAQNSSTGTASFAYGAYNIAQQNSTGLFTNGYGSYNTVQVNNGTVTNAYGVAITMSNSGAVTNWHGLYIAPNTGTAPTGNSYSLEDKATDPAYFTGGVGIGTTTPINSSVFDARGMVSLNGVISNGTTFTIASGCGTPTNLKGGATTGSFQAGQIACAPVITLPTAPNGWWCSAKDITTPADTINQTATAVTSCTLSGTVVASDVIVFHAEAY